MGFPHAHRQILSTSSTICCAAPARPGPMPPMPSSWRGPPSPSPSGWGKPEKLERAEGRDLGLRVFIGKRQAIVSSTRFLRRRRWTSWPSGPSPWPRRCRRIPSAASPIPPISRRTCPTSISAIPRSRSTETLIDAAARAPRMPPAPCRASPIPKGRKRAGAAARWRSPPPTAFRQGYAGTHSSVSVSVLAGEGTGMERDYDFTSAVYGSELEDPAAMGRRAGERAVKRLNPRKVATVKVPVVFDPRVANSLVGHLGGRHQRRRDRARHQLPQGQARPAHLPRRHRHRRRSPSPARPALRPLRRRGPAPPAGGSWSTMAC